MEQEKFNWTKAVLLPWEPELEDAGTVLMWVSGAMIAWVIVLQMILVVDLVFLGWVWVVGSVALFYVFSSVLARCVWGFLGRHR